MTWWLVFASQFCAIWTTIVYKYSSGYHTGHWPVP